MRSTTAARCSESAKHSRLSKKNLRTLEASGCLIVKEPGRYNVSTKLPGIGKVRCYCITDAIHTIDV